MDSILIILRKKMAQGLHLPLYWDYFLYHSYIQKISGERLQDHWSSCFYAPNFEKVPPTLKKLEGHIAFGLSVCLCVCVCVLTFEW